MITKKSKETGSPVFMEPEAIRFANEILLDITSPRNNMHQDAYATALCFSPAGYFLQHCLYRKTL